MAERNTAAQVARLEAAKLLESANAHTMTRLNLGEQQSIAVPVGPALSWALEKLALQRPDDPVQCLANLLRKYEADQRKGAIGVQVGKR